MHISREDLIMQKDGLENQLKQVKDKIAMIDAIE